MGQGVKIEEACIVNRNPATGEVISKVPCTKPEEIDTMVANAKSSLTSWKAKSTDERIELLKQGLKELEKVADELSVKMVQEMGKPLAEAKEEAEFATDKGEYLEILKNALQPKTFGSSTVVRSPLGVVVILSPWNFPADEILLLMLPALASGNTVIVKPSEVVPETGALVVKSLASVLPPNVLQLAQGDGSVGAPLVAHPDVSMVAMTGSSATGRSLLKSGASDMKRFVLELGGKDPMVVLADADLDKAASDAVEFSVCNTGQVCCSYERVYVAEPVYQDFLDKVVKYAAEYKVGNGMEDGVKVGPMVSQVQRDIVAGQVDDAKAKGAKVLFESPIPADAPEGSSFYPLTVVADVTKDMDINRVETFGPVVAISQYDGSEEESIRLANDTEYGLGSAVYSGDLDKAGRIANSIQAGQVGINCYPLSQMDVNCPWVGHKASGFGYHSGIEGFHNFSIPKTIVRAG